MIRVEGVLELSIDGIPARLVAEGRELRLELPRPRALLRMVSPAALRRLAASLDRSGLTLRVTGGRRTILMLGRGVDSRVARVLFRAPFVGFRRPKQRPEG